MRVALIILLLQTAAELVMWRSLAQYRRSKCGARAREISKSSFTIIDIIAQRDGIYGHSETFIIGKSSYEQVSHGGFLFPVVPSIGRQVLPATHTETAPSVLVACDDPMHREQTGFGRPGAKGLLHTG